MDVPGSSNQRDGRRRSTSNPPFSAEMKTLLEKFLVDKNTVTKEEEMGVYSNSQRGSSSRRVESESRRLQESISDVEHEMRKMKSVLERCRAQVGTQVTKRLQESLQETEMEVMELIEKKEASDEENKGLQREIAKKSRHR